MPVRSRCTVASSPPTVWWTIAWWWRSQTLAATAFSAPAKVKKNNSRSVSLVPHWVYLHSFTFSHSPHPPLRLVDSSGASEETGRVSERRRLQLCHHRSRDCSQKEHLLHRELLRPRRWHNLHDHRPKRSPHMLSSWISNVLLPSLFWRKGSEMFCGCCDTHSIVSTFCGVINVCVFPNRKARQGHHVLLQTWS